MHYKITSTIGSEVTIDNRSYIIGDCYTNKTKAPKDGDILYAFSKAKNPVDGLVWRFDGSATLDYHLFCKTHVHKIEGVNVDDFDIVIDNISELFTMAWKTARIDIQAKIRPSKDSKKAIADAKKAIDDAKRADDIKDIETRFAAGDIDAAEFGKLAIAIASGI